MKFRIGCFVIAVLTLIWWWQGTRPSILNQGGPTPARAGLSPQTETGDANHAGPDRTKAANRGLELTRYTHSPERLREFMLPAMAIDGLSLDAALQQLMAAYEDACRKSGETPLPLTFAISSGSTRKLTVHLPAGNFKTSVQLLAALSGMKASRKELEYRFEAMANERKSVNQSLQVSPQFQDALKEMAGLVSASSADPLAPPGSNVSKSIQECLGKLLLMDPSTHVSLGESGDLKLETSSASDAAMIAALARSFDNQPLTQLKSEAKIVELSPESNWRPPDVSQMSNGEIDRLMRDFAQRKGSELLTLPSVTSRNGQVASIEIIRELTYPTDDSANEFETREVGKVLEMQGNLLGFGHDVDLKFTDTIGGIDPSTGKAAFDKRTEMTDRNFKNDGGTKLVVQTRPDGSQTVLLYKSQTIDATGQPIH